MASGENAGKRALTLKVTTGDVRGAGTNAKVFVELRDTSQSVAVRQDLPGGFERSTTRTFTVNVPSDLKSIDEMHIGHDNSDVGAGWFLHSVKVMNQDDEEKHPAVFPCQRWLGISDSGGWSGPAERTLLPGKERVADQGAVAKQSRKELGLPPLKFRTGCAAAPHPDKEGIKARVGRAFGFAGDDAYCASKSFIAIADGVYAWRERGVDVGAFSQGLVKYMAEHQGDDDLRGVIAQAVSSALDSGARGSSTCCAIALDGSSSKILTANLGDSGFLLSKPLARGETVVYRSPQQEHTFGFPFQVGHHDNTDSADDAGLKTLSVGAGDVLIAATDGLWDNLGMPEIKSKIVDARSSSKRIDVGSLARSILVDAYANSFNKTMATPYALAAQEEFELSYWGGKKDDITVVVAVVEDEDDGK